MVIVLVAFDNRTEADEFVAECRDEDIPAGVVLDLQTLSGQVVQ